MDKIGVYKDLCERLQNMYDKEQEMYNDSFSVIYEKRGLDAAVTLIEDTWNRLDNLTLHQDNIKVYDSIMETMLLDLAHYCLMTLIEYKVATGKYLEKALAYTD